MRDREQAPLRIRFELPASIRQLTIALASVSVGLIAVSAVVESAILLGGSGVWVSLRSILSADLEQTIPAWFAASLLFLGAMLALTVWNRSDEHRWPWMVLAGVLLAMSADETIGVHERIGAKIHEALNTGGLLFFAAVIPGAVIAIVLVVGFTPLTKGLAQGVRRPFVLAAALFFGAVVGLEALGGLTVDSIGRKTFAYVLEVHAEELLELLGVTSMIYALATQLDQLSAAAPSPAPVESVGEAPVG